MRAARLSLDGPLTPARLPVVCRALWMVVACSGAALAVCDVGRVPADATAVSALARLQLCARRRGCRLQLRGAKTELLELVELMGLRTVLPS